MIILFAKICLFITIICANSLNIYPLIYGTYESKGGTWSSSTKNVLLGGWGIVSTYENKNLTIELDFYNNRFYGLKEKPNTFSKEQGLSWFSAVDSENNTNSDKFDFDVTNAKIQYEFDDFKINFGKFNRHWGFGKSSLIVSNKSPSFVQIGLDWDINSKINLEYFHGSLNSLIPNFTDSSYYSPRVNKFPNKNRFLAAHRINYKINPKITLSASELVIYGVRNFDLMYSIPIIPFWSLQHYIGDLDNIQISFDFKYQYNENTNFYGSIMIDEWSPILTFDEDERNWFAYQIGTSGNNLFFEDKYCVEFNWTDHRTYRHRSNINDFYNHDYPIGFWAGPHAEELYFNYLVDLKFLDFEIDFSKAKRGELTQEMLNNQYNDIETNYERFSNDTESITNMSLIIRKNFSNGISINTGVRFVDWKNSNFDPYNPNSNELIDINKESLIFGISYNFDIKNQKSLVNKNSKKIYQIK